MRSYPNFTPGARVRSVPSFGWPGNGSKSVIKNNPSMQTLPDNIEKLPILILYPHSRCNCRCVMCDIWKLETVSEISISDLERHAGDIQSLGVRWVVFSGGEPLMHSDLFRLSDRLREAGIRTTILTTGLLLAKYASSIVSRLDDVIVSLDGPRE